MAIMCRSRSRSPCASSPPHPPTVHPPGICTPPLANDTDPRITEPSVDVQGDGAATQTLHKPRGVFLIWGPSTRVTWLCGPPRDRQGKQSVFLMTIKSSYDTIGSYGHVNWPALPDIQVPKPWTADSESRRIHEALEQIPYAETPGFEGVWFSEHHFRPGGPTTAHRT